MATQRFWRGARADPKCLVTALPLCGQFSPLSHRAHVLSVPTPRWKQTLTASDLLLFTPAEYKKTYNPQLLIEILGKTAWGLLTEGRNVLDYI